MKAAFLLPTVQSGPKRILMGLVVAVAVMFLYQDATAATPTVDLGTAGDFAILAGSTITDVPLSSTIVTGDVGLYPGTDITGLTAGQVLGGTIYAAGTGFDTLLNGAKNDLSDAYTDAAGRTPTTTFVGADNQLGLAGTLIPGVYRFGSASTANLIGTLTLDANGETDPVWIFQATSTLVTASDSAVVFKDGIGSPCDVFWQVSSSATLGTGTDFAGTIMAYASVWLTTGATLDGRALAENEAVTLDHNTITMEDCTANGGGDSLPDTGSTLLLLGSGLATLLAFRGRFFSPA